MNTWDKLKNANWFVKTLLFIFSFGVVAGPLGMIIWILIAAILTGTYYTIR